MFTVELYTCLSVSHHSIQQEKKDINRQEIAIPTNLSLLSPCSQEIANMLCSLTFQVGRVLLF